MNQDKYPGIYAAMGEMEFRRHELPPMGEADMRMERMPMGETGMRFQENMHAECIDHETEIRDVQLAHAYVPFQKWCPTFMPLTALRKGTAFPGLVGVYGWEPKQEVGGEY